MSEKKITLAAVKTHWHYSWWKYMLMALVSVLTIDVIFTMTAYRPPEEKKVEVYMCNGYIDSIAMQEQLAPEFFAAYPEQEELSVLNINLAGDDMYVRMQFSAYAGAQQGDVLLLPVIEVESLASEGADEVFVELTPYVESGLIDVTGIDLSAGMLMRADGTKGLYAIPSDSLYGLMDLGCDPAGGLFCLMDYGGNDEHSAAVLGMILSRYGGQKPAGYDAQQQTQIPATQIFK